MSSQIIAPNTRTDIFARLFISDDMELTAEVARYLLSIKLSAADEDRVNQLSAKARAGSLTENEKRELEDYLHVGAMLGVMQSKARQLLKNVASDPPKQRIVD